MKYLIYFLSLVICVSCAAGNRVMTMDEYHEVSVGMTQKEVKEKIGKPYSVKKLENNQVQYTYVEKLHAGTKVLQERHYLITFTNGKVTSKKVLDFNRPAWQGNSYEMQTSLNDKEDAESEN